MFISQSKEHYSKCKNVTNIKHPSRVLFESNSRPLPVFYMYAILKTQKEQPPSDWPHELSFKTALTRQSTRVVFLCLKALSDKHKYNFHIIFSVARYAPSTMMTNAAGKKPPGSSPKMRKENSTPINGAIP